MKDIKEEITITFEELEVMRLGELEGKEQSEIGEEMHISQPTVSRHRKSAYQKLAKALTEGIPIRISSPNDFFHCEGCGNTWSVPEDLGVEQFCSECGSNAFHFHETTINKKERKTQRKIKNENRIIIKR